MTSSQLLYPPTYILHIKTRAFQQIQLHSLCEIQKPLNKLTINKSIWLCRLTLLILECSISVEVQIPECSEGRFGLLVYFRRYFWREEVCEKRL